MIVLRYETLRLWTWLTIFTVITAGCGGSREELIAGVNVPIPSGMEKSERQGVELTLPGLGAAQVSFKGKKDPQQIIDFYRKEMKDRGWRPGMGIVAGGGMLSFVKEGQTLMVTVGRSAEATTLTILIGKTGKN